MQKQILTLLISGFCLTAFAQDTVQKRWPDGTWCCRNVGGPSHSNLRISKSPENVNLTYFEIQIDPAAGGDLMISMRSGNTKDVKDCNNCNISGRLIVKGNASNNLELATKTPATVKTSKGANRKITFKSSTGQEYSVVTGSDGKFSLSTVPAGTYSIWVGGKEVILDYTLTSTVVKANPKSSN